LGYAFDRARLLNGHRGRPKIGFWLDWNAPAERINALLAQATTTPKVYHINNGWFLLCAMNDQAVLLQKSATGKPEGPYEDFTVLATRGGYPSLFIDGDETPYLVLADAWIAKVKPDLTALAEDIRPLLPAPGSSIADNRLTLGERGVCLFKDGGTYYVFAPRWQTHDDRASYDAVLWTSDNVYGPYVETTTVLRGTGPVTVFQDTQGGWRAVAGLPNDGPPRILEIALP